MDSSKKIMVAVNQTIIVDLNYKLSDDDEVAFFPPMTGG
jgi:molybdopterin converting factor small subunit